MSFSNDDAYHFSDLVDVTAFSRLLDNLYQATGIPSGVVDANGELLCMSSGDNACAVFHRSHPVATERCRDSNLALMHNLHDGCVVGGLCKNGLMDYATPVVIEGRQLATLFVGQILHTPPDEGYFRDQAEKLGFDEQAYLASIAAIPVVDKVRVDDLMGIMVEMAQMLAASGLARLRHVKLERDVNLHAERNIQLKDILDFSPVAMGWSENEAHIEYVNRQFTQLFGYTLDDLPSLETWYQRAYPDADYRETVVNSWRKAVAAARQGDTPPPELEADITCKDGSVRSIIVRATWVGQRRMVSFTDITERKHVEEMLRVSEVQSRDHDRLLQAVLESSPEIIVFALDCNYRYLAFNDKHRATMAAIWGKEITVGMNMLEVIGAHPDRDKAKQGFDRALTGVAFVTEDAYGDEALLRQYWLNYFAPIRGEDGSTIGLTCFVLDISERRRSELRIQAHDAMLEMLAQDADLPSILGALVKYIESEDTGSMCSIMLADAEVQHLFSTAGPNLPPFYLEAINGIEIAVGVGSCCTAAALGERVIVEDIMDHEYWKPYRPLAEKAGLHACWSEPILSSKGKVLGTFATYHAQPQSPTAEDLERIAFATNLAAIAIESRQVHDELERQAHSDYLTGLDNRRHFMSQAESELARSLRYERQLSILMLDIDHFKQINDTYGHKVGDLVLQRLAAVCRAALRNIDLIGRIGGEEFAVLLPEACSDQAMEAAERLRAELAAAEFRLDSGLLLHFTVSIGVVTLADDGANLDTLLNQADRALYLAKSDGRDRVRQFNAGISP